MANEPPKWATSKARELLEKDLLSGRIPLERWTAANVYNLPDRPEFRLFEYKKFVTNLRNLRKRIKEQKQDATAAALALAHDRVIYPVAAVNGVNNHQGGAPRWEGSLAQKWLNDDIDEGKHEMMQPMQLRQTRLEYMKFDKVIFGKHIHQEVKTRKFIIYLKEKQEKKKKKKGR
jgi:hypothetical protein